MNVFEAFERHATEYDAWFERNRATYEAELNAVRVVLPHTGAGLDIGVGTGRFAAPLGIRCGVDPSPAMAAIARSRGIEVTIGRAESLPFATGHFEYAVMVTTICFVDDLGVAFREAARVLKPGGHLIVGFIDRHSPLGRTYATRKDPEVFYRHARFYSPEEVCSQLELSGFHGVIASQTIFEISGEMSSLQPVKPGYGEGSFVVLRATR
jgi:SAM-dependent methyltransferase